MTVSSTSAAGEVVLNPLLRALPPDIEWPRRLFASGCMTYMEFRTPPRLGGSKEVCNAFLEVERRHWHELTGPIIAICARLLQGEISEKKHTALKDFTARTRTKLADPEEISREIETVLLPAADSLFALIDTQLERMAAKMGSPASCISKLAVRLALISGHSRYNALRDPASRPPAATLPFGLQLNLARGTPLRGETSEFLPSQHFPYYFLAIMREVFPADTRPDIIVWGSGKGAFPTRYLLHNHLTDAEKITACAVPNLASLREANPTTVLFLPWTDKETKSFTAHDAVEAFEEGGGVCIVYVGEGPAGTSAGPKFFSVVEDPKRWRRIEPTPWRPNQHPVLQFKDDDDTQVRCYVKADYTKPEAAVEAPS